MLTRCVPSPAPPTVPVVVLPAAIALAGAPFFSLRCPYSISIQSFSSHMFFLRLITPQKNAARVLLLLCCLVARLALVHVTGSPWHAYRCCPCIPNAVPGSPWRACRGCPCIPNSADLLGDARGSSLLLLPPLFSGAYLPNLSQPTSADSNDIVFVVSARVLCYHARGLLSRAFVHKGLTQVPCINE